MTLLKKIDDMKRKESELTAEVRSKDAALLSKMADAVKGTIADIGLNMLQKGKQDSKGELYDASYYPIKMIILGKSDPVPYRPDDINKTVTDQFCVLSEEGRLYEVMYSSDGFLTDSYLNPIDPAQALKIYGYELIFMLYRAMKDYLASQEEIVTALGKVLEFIVMPQTDNK